MGKIHRIYVEKKSPFAISANNLLKECQEVLQIKNLESIRIIYRYDIENIDEQLFRYYVETILSEPPVDSTFYHLPEDSTFVFGIESLPGQFDQRADSAQECIQLINQGERPIVRVATMYLLYGKNVTPKECETIKGYLLNPVESREATFHLPDTLKMEMPVPAKIETVTGFIHWDLSSIENFRTENALAMDQADLLFCQQYFQSEKRDPTFTEIRVIDTYWSDHCRHTTFSTELETIEIEDPFVHRAFENYLHNRKELYGDRKDKPITLMDMAT
ncbi:MAG: phosphoribosylformylglycinamidine synthase, partial [Clostridiales bacterium]|nr:phosphoribosylformylglycinamidine synthase [Clostridiales bacterium]